MPTSYQESAGSSKSAKFVQANPLDPMIRPFDNGLNDEQKEIQQVIAENVNKRLEKAMVELKEKHQNGTNEIDAPEFAPTGFAYQMIYKQQQQLLAAQQQSQQALQQQHVVQFQNNSNNNNNKDDDSDYDSLLDDDELDDNPVLEELRRKRIEELKQQHIQRAENIAKGHGQYRTITQDEFLPECTGTSEWVVVHFYHKDFQRCNIMDHHLHIISKQHIECKFIRIDAEKAPFFVTKLNIKTLPTVLVFQNGKTTKRLIGFDGLSSSSNNNNNKKKDVNDPDQWKTYKLQQWLASTNAIQYTPSDDDNDEIQESMKRLSTGSRGFPTKSLYRGGVEGLDD